MLHICKCFRFLRWRYILEHFMDDLKWAVNGRTSEDVQWSNWSMRDLRYRSALWLLGEVTIVVFKGHIKKEPFLWEPGLKRLADTTTATLNEPGGGNGTFQWSSVKRAALQASWTKGCNYITSSSCLQLGNASLHVYKSSQNFVLFLKYCFLNCARLCQFIVLMATINSNVLSESEPLQQSKKRGTNY